MTIVSCYALAWLNYEPKKSKRSKEAAVQNFIANNLFEFAGLYI